MGEYAKMIPANQTDIYSDLMSRVDNFRPQYDQLRGMEAQAYASPATSMQQYYDRYGMGGTQGPSGAAVMSSMLQNIGQQYGSADALSNAIDTQKGRIGDMARTVNEQYNAQRQSLMDRYGMLSPLFNAALQREEAAKARAAQAAAFRGFGTGGLTPAPTNNPDPSKLTVETGPVQQKQGWGNALIGDAWRAGNGLVKNMPYLAPMLPFNSLNQAYKMLKGGR